MTIKDFQSRYSEAISKLAEVAVLADQAHAMFRDIKCTDATQYGYSVPSNLTIKHVASILEAMVDSAKSSDSACDDCGCPLIHHGDSCEA